MLYDAKGNPMDASKNPLEAPPTTPSKGKHGTGQPGPEAEDWDDKSDAGEEDPGAAVEEMVDKHRPGGGRPPGVGRP